MAQIEESTVRIRKGGLAPEHKDDLAYIVCEAFAIKVAALKVSRERAVETLLDSIDWDAAFYAYRGERLVGVAGIFTRAQRFLGFRFPDLRRRFGLFRALFFQLILGFEGRPAADEFRIETLAVAAEARGQGIGTRLLNEAERHAREHGYAVLSLDVVDTNLRARQLYERLGFREIRTEHYGRLTRRAGFTGSSRLEKPVPVGPASSSSQG
jgi:ribosomal protein S18 acetylase RimI-like enzyme